MDRYDKAEILGEGTYGVVYKAREKETGDVVALKKIYIGKQKDGIEFTSLREIKLLQEFQDDYVIRLRDVFYHNRNINLVFDYMEHDLEEVIRNVHIGLTPAVIKTYMWMIIKSVEACHANFILHRDLKPNNFLVSEDGKLKLADFGLARTYGSPNPRYSYQVVTRWYRAPELLFGAQAYGPGVDMWAVGCIFAELMLRRPFLRGDTDIDQLSCIFAALGTPTEEDWPGMTSLPHYHPYEPCTPPPLQATFTAAPREAVDLLQSLLTFNPEKRITASEALQHEYFSTAPKILPYDQLPKLLREAPNKPTLPEPFAPTPELEAVRRKLF